MTDAEKHWLSGVGLSTVHLGKNGSIFEMFMRFKTAFEWRMLYNRVAVKTSAAKLAKGNPSEPPDDGVYMSGSVCSSSSASRSLASATLQRMLSSEDRKYDVLRALERLQTGHALNLDLADDPKYGYMTLLNKRINNRMDETMTKKQRRPQNVTE